MRRAKAGTTWPPQGNDRLLGEIEYGTFTDDYKVDASFSRKFGDFDEFLFASGDGQIWLITDKEAVGGVLQLINLNQLMADWNDTSKRVQFLTMHIRRHGTIVKPTQKIHRLVSGTILMAKR